MRLIHKSIAEAIGTFAIVFVGCGSMMIAERFPGSISSTAISAALGLSVAAMIYALGHISGAHFNPAVTLAFSIARHFPKKEVLAYWIAQFSGATVAILILQLILPPGMLFGATILKTTIISSIIWEMILTFFLMFVIIAVATDTRAVGTMAGAAIGATVMFCAILAGPVTGASMNPARSFGPALFQGTLSTVWVFFLGPFSGATIAALLYDWIRCEPEKKNAKGCC